MNKIKILGYIMARNEWPLLGLSIVHALQNEIDHILIIDHCSQDETHEGLLSLQKEWPGRLTVFRLNDERYLQETTTNIMMHMDLVKNYDWVYVFDADEFILLQKDKSLNAFLNGLPETTVSVRYEIQQWIAPIDMDEKNLSQYEQISKRAIPSLQLNLSSELLSEEIERGNINFFDIPFPSKVIVRSCYAPNLLAGAHGLKQKNNLEEIKINHDFFVVGHLPLLSKQRLNLKSNQGELLIKTNFPKWHGWQNQMLRKIQMNRKLDLFWQAHSISDEFMEIDQVKPSITEDLRLKDIFKKIFQKKTFFEIKKINDNPFKNIKENSIPIKNVIDTIENFRKLQDQTLAQRTEETKQQARTITTLNQSLSTKDNEIHNLVNSSNKLKILNNRLLNNFNNFLSSKSIKYIFFLREIFFRTSNSYNFIKKFVKEIEEKTNQIYVSQKNNLKKKFAIITCNINSYDNIIDPLVINPNADYFCYSDRKIQCNTWQLIPINYYNINSYKTARYIKLNSYQFLEKYEYIFWVDSSFVIINDFNDYLIKLKKSKFQILFEPHWERNCVYDEIKAASGRADNDTLSEQNKYLGYIKFPKQFGLVETGVYGFSSNSEISKKILKCWFKENNKWSHRDQISLPVALKDSGLKINKDLYFHEDVEKVPRFNKNNFVFRSHNKKYKENAKKYNFNFDNSFFIKKTILKFDEAVDIIIPIYNALSDVKLLLDSLEKTVDSNKHRIYLIDDNSNSATKDYLRKFSKNKTNYNLIENESNIGFCKNINKGIKISTNNVKIILNSDTILSKDWLSYLINPFSNNRVGITSPISNAATYQSVPHVYDENSNWKINPYPKISLDNINETLSKQINFEYARVEILNGFCLAIHSKVFNDIGYFDEINFEQGYGEECDFCIRAFDAGFELLLVHDCYIYHAKSKSFQDNRIKLVKKSGDKLKDLYGSIRLKNINESLKSNPFLQEIRNITSKII